MEADDKAIKALQRLHRTTQPFGSTELGSVGLRGCLAGLVALIPVALIVALTLALVEPSTLEHAPRPEVFSAIPGPTAAETMARATFAAGAAGTDLSVSPEDATKALGDRIRATTAAPQIAAHQLYRKTVLFACALLVLTGLACLTIWANHTVARRHRSVFLSEVGNRERLVVYVASAAFCSALWLALTAALHDALPWVLGTRQTLPIAILLVVWFVLLLLAIQVTAAAAWLYGAAYPAAGAIAAIRQPVLPPRKIIDDGVEANVIASDPPGDDMPESILDRILRVFSCNLAALDGKALADWQIKAGDCITVTNALVKPLLAVLIVALITLHLGLDLAADGRTGPAPLVAAAADASRVWLIAVGFGFSLALGCAFLPPVVRLKPFAAVEASTAAKPAPIAHAATYGGGFQIIFAESLQKQMVRALDLLAPALTSTLPVFLAMR